eukprot:TRINITY_DN17016_c0_g1_i1.p2 TRINITY_DN17016_c0_g1~~TRINITY_DN17016_c0_g1_i1.p2  ORF type:complete len:107 (+),score=5.44 TRINITY_DN17016_c0_g1_i1:99-419(+)
MKKLLVIGLKVMVEFGGNGYNQPNGLHVSLDVYMVHVQLEVMGYLLHARVTLAGTELHVILQHLLELKEVHIWHFLSILSDVCLLVFQLSIFIYQLLRLWVVLYYL